MKESLTSNERVCTCHPTGRPPICQHRYAATECQDAYRAYKATRVTVSCLCGMQGCNAESCNPTTFKLAIASIEIRDLRAALATRSADETTRDDARDAVRYRWLRDWYHREGKRAEIDPYGHIAVRTLPEWEALLDAAIARSSPEEPTQKPEDLRMEQVRACMRQYCSEQNGRRFGKSKVAAVKLYREIHGCGLKEAVLACEVLIPEKATARPIPPGRMCNTHGNWNCSECCPPENGDDL